MVQVPDPAPYELGGTAAIHGRAVFAVLNEDTLTLFDNINVNSVIKTVNVRNIGLPTIVQTWSKFNCL